MSANASITVEGVIELRDAIKQATTMMRREVYRAVEETAYDVHAAAVKRIQSGPASGMIYEKHDPRRTHKASAPGQPPMSDTGRLAGSIEVKVSGMEAQVFTPVDYGRTLEFGTNRVAARPWLFPSVEENRPNFLRKLRSILK